jgi:hypothetical protein
MATENRLWGAPRIHGELPKLGITISERTVSRYLPDRLMARSQTWRTFLSNHFGDLAFTSTVTSSYAPGDDDVDDACVLPFRPDPSSRDGQCASNQWQLSIGLLCSTARLLAGVSPRVTFTAVHAHAPAFLHGPTESWAVAIGPKARKEVPFVRRLHLAQGQ